jgi:membrane protein
MAIWLHLTKSMLPAFDIPLSWTELLKRTIRETNDDDCLGLAAQLAYYFFLALFPTVLFMLAVASFFPLTNVIDDVVRALQPVAPAEVLSFLENSSGECRTLIAAAFSQ